MRNTKISKQVRKAVVGNYRNLWWRLYSGLKVLLVPYEQISSHVPKNTDVLDVGCGYGILSFFLGFESPRRRILGIDINCARVTSIEKIVTAVPDNVSFRAGDLTVVGNEHFGCVVMEEVLHHIPKEQQQAVLDRLGDLLSDDGVFILRENNKRPSFRYYFVNIPAEYLLYPMEEKANFRTNMELEKMLSLAGFEVEVLPVPWYSLVDISIFICRKKSVRSEVAVDT